MGLKTQLTLIALVTLLLPWAGCQYIRESEQALRLGQQELLLASARNVAASLDNVAGLSPPPGGGALYLHALRQRPLLDGFASDWVPEAPAVGPALGPERSRFAAARYGESVLVHTATTEADAELVDLVVVRSDGDVARFRFVGDAPGPLVAEALDGDGDSRIRGHWDLGSTESRLEAALPFAIARHGLGIVVRDAAGALLAATFDAPLPPAPIAPLTALVGEIERYRPRDVEIAVVDADGWVRARAGSLGALPLTENDAPPTLIERLYRPVLDRATPPTVLAPATGGRDPNAFVRQALSGTASSAWLSSGDDYDATAIVGAAAPITRDGRLLGALVLRQNAAGRQLLTNRALTRLATTTFAVVAALALLLFGYAVALSFRIRRLAQAADTAMDARGRLSTALPSASASDEIGSLSRSFSTLLGRVAEYNDYLKALAGRLSHELRTPLSVVSSSLENLEAEWPQGANRDYAMRARDGVARLQKLLRTMSEATRTEQLAAEATRLVVDLGAIVEVTVEGYRDAWPARQFALSRPDAPLPVFVAPELIVQLLDKFVDNAVSFTGDGDTIDIAIARATGTATITVTNPGPPLPDRLATRLFESLVSVRPGGGAHLGFGLYVARLIADAHGGVLAARNLDDRSGVAFSLTLPLAAG